MVNRVTYGQKNKSGKMKKELVHLAIKMTVKVNSGFGLCFFIWQILIFFFPGNNRMS